MPWYQLPKSGVTYFESDDTPPDGAIEVEAPPGTTPIPSLTERVEDLEAFEASVPGTFAPVDSPALSGTPTAPTPAPGDNSTKIATTAYVRGATSYGIPRTFTQPGVGQTQPIGGANRAAYMRVVDSGTDMSSITLSIGNSSGNISVAVLTSPAGRNNPNTRVATTGAIACPSGGDVTGSLGATVATTVNHWFALSCDNNTAAFLTVGGHSSAYAISTAAKGIAAYMDASHPIPASPTPTACFVPPYALVGV